MKPMLCLLMALSALTGCSTSDDGNTNPSQNLYFPPLAGNTWETVSPAELGWNQNHIQPLLDYLEQKHTKSFIVLVDGKIAMEHYFNGHGQSSPWYWASAGKILTSAAVGIAQKQGLLDIDDSVSDYLGSGWSSLSPEQENAITIKHLLTMTSGLDDSAGEDCVTPECLTYVAPAGTRWAYHNVYVLLQDVIAEASGQSWESYFNANLKGKIGMTGLWTNLGDFSIYNSNARSMARFGLLALAKGEWNNEQVIPENYLEQATQTSQQLNKAYGYLWWINGEESYRLPQTQMQFSGSLIPSGPSDMYMALGKNDQKIYVIPSKKMVIVRMGEAAEASNWALSTFDQTLWQKINAIIE